MERAHGLFRDLESEWRVVGSNADAVAQLSLWAKGDPVFDGFESPCEVVAGCQARGDSASANEVLRALLRAGAWDRLAARAVLQALLPALAGVTRRARAATASAGGDAASWDQEVVAIAWEQIVALTTNPPAWPSTKVADLTWTRVRTLINRQRRQAAASAPLDEARQASASPARSVSEQLAVVLGEAVRQGTIDRVAAGVVWRTRVLGFSPADTARAVGRTPAWVYKQRERAERLLVNRGVRLPAAS